MWMRILFFSLKLQLLRFIWGEVRTRERERERAKRRRRKKEKKSIRWLILKLSKETVWVNVCMLIKSNREASERRWRRGEKKRETTTKIAFAQAIGETLTKERRTMTSIQTAHQCILECYPMIKKVVDSTLESWMTFKIVLSCYEIVTCVRTQIQEIKSDFLF